MARHHQTKTQNQIWCNKAILRHFIVNIDFLLDDLTKGIHHNPEKVTCVHSDGRKVKTSGYTDKCVNLKGEIT